MAVKNRMQIKQKVDQMAAEQLKYLGIVEKMHLRIAQLKKYRQFLYQLANKPFDLERQETEEATVKRQLKEFLLRNNTLDNYCFECACFNEALNTPDNQCLHAMKVDFASAKLEAQVRNYFTSFVQAQNIG